MNLYFNRSINNGFINFVQFSMIWVEIITRIETEPGQVPPGTEIEIIRRSLYYPFGMQFGGLRNNTESFILGTENQYTEKKKRNTSTIREQDKDFTLSVVVGTRISGGLSEWN